MVVNAQEKKLSKSISILIKKIRDPLQILIDKGKAPRQFIFKFNHFVSQIDLEFDLFKNRLRNSIVNFCRPLLIIESMDRYDLCPNRMPFEADDLPYVCGLFQFKIVFQTHDRTIIHVLNHVCTKLYKCFNYINVDLKYAKS